MLSFGGRLKRLIMRWGQAPLCNGRRDRAPHIGEFCFPVCYRCLGNAIGSFVGCAILSTYEYSNSMLPGMILLVPTVIDHFFLRKDTNGRGNLVRFVNGVFMGVGFVLIIRSTLLFIRGK